MTVYQRYCLDIARYSPSRLRADDILICDNVEGNPDVVRVVARESDGYAPGEIIARSDMTRLTDDYTGRVTSVWQGVRWFGDAIRGDWSDVDGRGIKAGVYEYSQWAEAQSSRVTFSDVLEAALRTMDVSVRIHPIAPSGFVGCWGSTLPWN